MFGQKQHNHKLKIQFGSKIIRLLRQCKMHPYSYHFIQGFEYFVRTHIIA